MKFLSKLIFGFILVSVFSTAYAGAWAPRDSILRIYQHETGNIYIRLKNAASMVNPEACKSPYYFVVAAESKANESILKVLLSTKAANGTASIYINGCIGSYPRIRHVIYN